MNELKNNSLNRCVIPKCRYSSDTSVWLVLLFAASEAPAGLMAADVNTGMETANEAEAPVECPDEVEVMVLEPVPEHAVIRADKCTKSDHGENDLDNFFDPGSHPVTKPKLTKPSRIEVMARAAGIYVLHTLMGITDWFKKLISSKAKKHGKAKTQAKKRTA